MSIQGVGHPAQVTVTYVGAAPDNTSYHTLPMPDPSWLNRSAQQQYMMTQMIVVTQPASTFTLNRQLTSQQQMHLVTARPQSRQQPIYSLPELETSRNRPVVTQSARYNLIISYRKFQIMVATCFPFM